MVTGEPAGERAEKEKAMKTAILTACWLSAVLGISITPVLAQTSNQVPHDVDCKQFMILKGFMDQVQLRCNFANVAEGNYRETARECAPQLGNPKAETLIAFGTKSFEDMEKQDSNWINCARTCV